MELSKKSLEEAKKFLNKYQEAYSKGIDNAVKYATEMMYNKVLEYCYANGISNHTSQIQWQYDDNAKSGRVWTDDMVIIFNEMGTGIVGSNNPHPNPDGPLNRGDMMLMNMVKKVGSILKKMELMVGLKVYQVGICSIVHFKTLKVK